MQSRRFMGATSNKIKGKLKEIEGKVTGDPVRQAEGAVQSTAGKIAATVKAGARRVRAKAKAAKAVVSTKVGRKAAAARVTP
jgi:uncharacterized protein YjbJ (UPF0337 family)